AARAPGTVAAPQAGVDGEAQRPAPFTGVVARPAGVVLEVHAVHRGAEARPDAGPEPTVGVRREGEVPVPEAEHHPGEADRGALVVVRLVVVVDRVGPGRVQQRLEVAVQDAARPRALAADQTVDRAPVVRTRGADTDLDPVHRRGRLLE